jgi:dihydrofolate reductase
MRKIILWMSVSVDGYIEGPDHDISWHMVDDELHAYVNAELDRLGAFLHGRVTYQLMEGYWPTADQDPDSPEPVKEFARIWRDKPKIVYSRTLERAGWNTTIVRDVVTEEVETLKAEPGGDMSIGGADIAAEFMRHGLIDEFRIYVHPVAIGTGTPLFPPAGPRIDMRLVGTRVFGNGVVLLHYRRA